MQHRLLFIDDEAEDLPSRKAFFERRGFIVTVESSPKKAVEIVRRQPSFFSVAIVDFQMQELDGAETTRALLEINPELFILILSGDPSQDAVLLTLRAKAKSFVRKSEGAPKLLGEVQKLCSEYEDSVVSVPDSTMATNERMISSVGLVGASDHLAEVARRIINARPINRHIMLLGETGVGKEMVAHALRKNETDPFVVRNCATFVESLASSELFGHEKGAFTGASVRKRGVFEQADGGILFLDEVHTLSRDVQAKLLRVAATGEFSPVGGDDSKPIKVSVRIITAGTAELEAMAQRKEFLPDLLHRLAINKIEILPLRERPEDIRPLLHAFSSSHNKELGTTKGFSASTLPYLERYSWPGNVRELFNLVGQLFVDVDKRIIRPIDLPKKFLEAHDLGQSNAAPSLLRDQRRSHDEENLRRALSMSHSQREAAARLGVAPSTITHMCRRYNIDPKQFLMEKENGSDQAASEDEESNK